MQSPKTNHFYDANRKLWDARTKVHVHSRFYDLSTFLQTKDALSLMPTELMLLTHDQINQSSLLHLQCHFGMDTLSWAKLGAKCVGIDFSEEAINTARKINEQLGLDAQFIKADIYELNQLLNITFDVIFTSYGVLCWLHDLKRWGSIVAHHLKLGGIFTMVEFHPFIYMYDWENVDTKGWKFKYPYFYEAQPIYEKTDGTYTDSDTIIALDEYTWIHSLSEILTALMDAGLRITHFQEYPYSHYNVFPEMVESEKDRFQIKGQVGFPLMFSLMAEKI